jgi:transketolase
MVHEALKAAEILSQQELNVEVIDCYSVNPLPSQIILASVRRTGCCVVAEEHSCRGGLGEAVASLVSRNYPVPVKFVSVEDRFGQSGTPEELQEYYGLTGAEVVSSAVQAWTMRRR